MLDNYTTVGLIGIDKEGTEKEKSIISIEAYAMCEAMNDLKLAIGRLALKHD